MIAKKVFQPAALVLLSMGLALAGCSGNTGKTGNGGNKTSPPPASSGAEGGESAGWQGTITMFAQSYTPNAKNIAGLKQLTALREIADQYETDHPGIKIEFIDEEFKDYTQTVRVKAAAGEMYDVFWGQWADLNNIFPKGIAEDLTVYFDQPNPYIPDKPTWREAMNQTVISETTSPDGKSYNINGDYVATAFFYNKTLFEQAGISEAPQTWGELIEVTGQLKAAGIAAMSQSPDYDWFQRHFLSDFYAEQFDEIAGFDGNPGVSSLDQSVAIAKGMLSTEDERFMGWWPMFKSLTDNWRPDHLALEPAVVGTAARNDFLAGKTAIFYDGSWLPGNAKEAKIDFELGSFNFPVLSSADSAFTTGTDVSGAVGGPNAAFQFAISTPEANATMKEPGKLEAVIDWLHYVGTPAHVEQVVNENGTFVPTWPGTSPAESMKELASQASNKLAVIGVGGTSPNLGKNIQRIFGLYLSGNIDLERAKADMQKELDAAVKDYQSKNNVDLAQY
ncbi:ABC transporter substrate-binding protein [Paenibacillus sp. 598K]|uniref:ABC transporter substrate-binding protein n=1 Tax=Paenibacillus sp. 598K TaxID=1117987 RepID=UPI000FF91C38|nr:extracellular solute-binding protein [Paenibacillus sp. 598K]GBF74253.1 ABC transporter substrate-binding protein [Paenibacillus sp. 598K]